MAHQLPDAKAAGLPLAQLFKAYSFQSFTAPEEITRKTAHEYFGEPVEDGNFERTEQRLSLIGKDGVTKNIYRVLLGDNKSVYVADFRPSKGANLRPMSLEIAGELISSSLLAHRSWQGSRFQTVRGWAQDYVSLKQVDSLDGKVKEKDERKFMAAYVKWLVRAINLDAKDTKMNATLDGFDPVREELKVLKNLVGLWNERGYKAGDSMHVKEANEGLRGLYSLFKDKDPVFGPKFDRSGVTNPLSGYNEAVKHGAIEYASAAYQSDADFYNAFLALNAGYIRSDLFKARRDISVPTTYPGLKLDVPAALLPDFGDWPQGVAQPRVAYQDSNRQKGDAAIYVFQKFDGEKLLGETRVNAEIFQRFRREAHPTFDLGEGSEGRYLYCDRSTPAEPKYLYTVTAGIGSMVPGRTVTLDENEQMELIRCNQGRSFNGTPVTSTNTRGAITDHLEHFFSDSMPTPMKNSAPDADGLKRLKAFVSDKVNGAYIPVWADVGDPVSTPDLVTREMKIAAFMGKLLAPLRVGLVDPGVTTHLENLQDSHLSALTSTVDDKLNKRVFNLYHEEKHGGPPDRVYATYRNEEDKYSRWKSELTSPTDSPEQVDHTMDHAMNEAMEHAEKNGFAHVIPNHFGTVGPGDQRAVYIDATIDYAQKNTLEILTELAAVSHNTKLERFSSLGDAAKYLDPKIVELVYNHTFEKFLTHFSLAAEKLPYLRPQFSLEFSEKRAGLRMRLTAADYLEKDVWATLTPTQQQTVTVSVGEKGLNLDDAERMVLKHIQVAERLKDADVDNDFQERIVKALTIRAGRELTPALREVPTKPEELKRIADLLLKDMLPRSAQKVLDAMGQLLEITPSLAGV